MSTVYIANRGFHDYTRAQHHGKLVALTVGNVDLKATDRLEEKIQHALRDAEATDILLLGGAPIIGALAQAYLQQRFGFANVLYYDPGRRDYVLRRGLDGDERRIVPASGAILCPNCERVIAEAPPGVTAHATEICELCQAEAEEEVMEKEMTR